MTLWREVIGVSHPKTAIRNGAQVGFATSRSIQGLMFSTLLTACMLPGLATDVVGADEKSSAPKAVSAKGAQAEAIRWVDDFAKVQVLFSKEDVERLQKEVAKFNPEEAQAWLERTKEVREALGSTEWLRNRLWLKDFFQVQAIYSDEQIAEFREAAKQAARESPKKFKEILAKIDEERQKLLSGAATNAQLREQQLDLVNAYRQQEAAARAAALKAAAKRPKPSAPEKAPTPPSKTARRTRPMIDSMDAARWAIMLDLWGDR